MIRLPLPDIKVGMVLARSLVSDTGELLLATGFIINDRILYKMKTMDLTGCWVFEEGTEFVVPEELISEQFANQAHGILKENSELMKQALDLRGTARENIKHIMSEPQRFKNIVTVEKVKNLVRDILETLMKKQSTTINLSSIRHKNGWLYQHALDTAITVILLGQNLKYPTKDLEELALGALLMDTGMVILADSLVNKTMADEEEKNILREHPTFGYTILRENEEIPLTVAHVAYQHHERQDGNGFPRKLRGTNLLPTRSLGAERGMIHRYAEIASVADIYMSLIAPRPGGVKPRAPEDAIRILIQAAGTHLNRAIVDALVTMIPIFPVGSKIVVVQDNKFNKYVGYSGVVAKYRPECPEYPEIIVLYNRDKQKVKPFTLDLADQKAFKIQFAKL